MTKYLEWLDDTKRSRLSNGLTVLTHRLQNSEVAALHFTVQAGYFCETDSEVGLAHLLEHMYFKGSARFPEPGTLGIQMKALGGSINATTSYDQTTYFCEVPAENLLPALGIMADAFAAPIFPEDELKKETEVVIEEFNRKLDSPAAFSQEKLISLAYTKHRMKRWRIGTPEQLRSYTRDHLFDYFHRYYQPQNMVITVTGKFDEEMVRNEIERWMGGMTNRELKKDFGPAEPPQKELRYGFHRATATQSYLHFGFHGPGVLHPDSASVDFLTFLLSAGKSSRLHRHVVEQKRSASVASCGSMSFENIGLISLSAITEPDKIRAAGQDLWTVVKDLCENGIATDELTKIKNKLRLHQAMQTEDALNVAELLGYFEAYDSFEKIEDYTRALQELQQDQLIATAEKYFDPDHLSALEFVNEDLEPLSANEYKDHLLKGFAAPEIVLPPPLSSSASDGLGKAQTLTKPLIHQGAVTYILQPDRHFPFVAGGIFFVGGRTEEDRKNAGITHLLFRSILKGTSRLTAEQIAFRFDALGNPPRFNCYRDYSGFMFEALPESFLEMWNLLIHCMNDAQFPSKEIETEKGKMAATIRRNLDDNFVRPLQLFQQAYFEQHPYSLPEVGFEESVSQLQAQNLKDWKQRIWGKYRAIVVLIGSFDPQRLIAHLDQTLPQVLTSSNDFRPPLAVWGSKKKENVELRPKKQTAFVLGFPAPDVKSPDTYHYDVLQQILSGMGGRLFLNLRSKKSLAYTVHAANAASLYSGAFLTYIAGEASKEKEALEGMWQELQNLKGVSVTAEELENAKNALIGDYALSTQTAASRVIDYANCYLEGKPIPYAAEYRDRIRTVKEEDLLAAAQKSFREDQSTLGIVRGTGLDEDL